MQVLVRDNNIEQALKFLKKKMQREGIFREMKRRSAYEKPSEKRVREKAEAIRRARKLARKNGYSGGPDRGPETEDARARPSQTGIRPALGAVTAFGLAASVIEELGLGLFGVGAGATIPR